jgi:hypothetical protein
MALLIVLAVLLVAGFAAGPWLPQTLEAPSNSRMTEAEASALAKDIVPRVEELRGLKFKSPVPVQVVDDRATRSYFEERARKFWPEERVAWEQTAFAQIGLLPAGTDILAHLFDVLEEQAGGFYDPERDTFYVLDDMPRSAAPLIMAHELTHALDDQHYGIDSLLEKVLEDEDRSTAIGAVVEGSGTLVMSVFLLREVQSGRMSIAVLQEIQKSDAGRAEKLGASPLYLQRGLLAPYILGQTFVSRGKALGGLLAGVEPKDLDLVFADPPVSTEQILHPEKYWNRSARELPRAVSLPDLSSSLGAAWSLVERGNLGELNLAILVGIAPIDLASPDAVLPERWTNEAAAGWGGDAWQLYASGDRRATILATLWDSAKDAEEFERALTPLEGRKAFRSGDAVVLVAGAVLDRADRVAAQVFSALGASSQ